MELYKDWYFEIQGVPFQIRRVKSAPHHIHVGRFILFQDGKFKCRGTKKLCRIWAHHFARIACSTPDPDNP